MPVRNGQANAHAILGNRRLRAGTRLELRITAPNMIGALVRFRVRRTVTPPMTRYCLPPGVTSAQRC